MSSFLLVALLLFAFVLLLFVAKLLLLLNEQQNSNKMVTVTLRSRVQKSGRESLYLEYYLGNGKRKYEYLKLYLIQKPKTTQERQLNKETKKLAKSIEAKKRLEIQKGEFGFSSDFKKKGSFFGYFKRLTDERYNSTGNHGNWLSTYKHLLKFRPEGITFEQVDEKFLNDFKAYLLEKVAQNSAHSYFNKVRAALKQAFEEKIISDNPGARVKGIKQAETHREFLTLQELKAIAKAECEKPILKTAFLFSALTGLRWSDIQKLVWSEVRYSEEQGWIIQFRQKKTRGVEVLNISDQARKMIGDAGSPDERVFIGLKYNAWYNVRLTQWALRAGITKHITFHSARHTFATLQLTMGTDIYTVSKMLGHRELRTTQVYANIIDQKKKEAANRIPDIEL